MIAVSGRYAARASVILAVAGLAVLQVWSSPFQLSSNDIISYLNFGNAILDLDSVNAINGYWSPLYGLIQAMAMRILSPSGYSEFLYIRVVNFLIFLFAFAGFRYFLRELIEWQRRRVGRADGDGYHPISDQAFVTGGYALFLWFCLGRIGITCDTPDTLVAGLSFFAAGLVLLIPTESGGFRSAVGLGLVLGLAFLAKAIMFYVSCAFLVSVLPFLIRHPGGVPRYGATWVVFLLVAGPYIAALSIQKGRVTVGDSGRIAYHAIVLGDAPLVHWRGESPESGRPLHPEEQLSSNPDAFAFIGPIGGTYPPWQDASYWLDGLKFRFSLKHQLWVVERNLIYLYRIFGGALIFGLIVAVHCGRGWRVTAREIYELSTLIIPAALAIGLYLLCQTLDAKGDDIPLQRHPRYLAPFILIGVSALVASVRLPVCALSERLTRGLVAGTVMIVGINLGFMAMDDLRIGLKGDRSNIPWEIAERLQQSQIGPGSRIALIGRFGPGEHWAYLGRLRIVAELPDRDAFWRLTAERRRDILQRMGRVGARVAVAHGGAIPQSELVGEGWRSLGHGYFGYLL